MGKHYKYEIKYKIVLEYLQGELGYKRLAEKYNLSNESLIKIWVNQYLEFGPEGLDKKLQKKVYSRDFKVSVLRFRQENKLSYRETANHFKISNSAMLAAWQRKFDEEGILGLDNKQRGRPSKMKRKQSSIKRNDSPLKESEREELERLRNENEMLKAGIAYQKKVTKLDPTLRNQTSEKVKIIKELYETLNFGLSLLLKISEIAKSVYYYWINYFKKPDKNNEIVEAIKEIYDACDYTYGYRRVTQTLKNRGTTVNHKKVRRIMKELGLTCTKFNHKNRKYSSYKGTIGKVSNNLLKRRFNTDRPFQKIVTDITEFKLSDGTKLYLSPFMDLYNSEILSYSISTRPTLDIVINSLNEILIKRPRLNYRMTIHSDQGWHYQHKSYINILKENKIFQSMSRKANCLDNSLIENFFGLLKQEMFYGKTFDNFQQLEQAIHEYINFYNNSRIKTKLKGLSPTQYRKQTFEIVY